MLLELIMVENSAIKVVIKGHSPKKGTSVVNFDFFKSHSILGYGRRPQNASGHINKADGWSLMEMAPNNSTEDKKNLLLA